MPRPTKPKTRNSKRRFSIYACNSTLQKLDEYTKRYRFETRGEGLEDLLTKIDSFREQCTLEYLEQLEKEKTEMIGEQDKFRSSLRLLENEIVKVRTELERLAAAEANANQSLVGETSAGTSGHSDDASNALLKETIYVPVAKYPNVDFVSQILGTRSSTLKKLEKATGCSIAVRGKGSLRDKNKERRLRGKPTWEHLTDELHVLVQCNNDEDGNAKLKHAVEEVKRLLEPPPEEDEEGQWSRAEVDKLRRAIRACNPLTRDQWAAVANSIGNSRSWEDCKMYAETALRFRPKLVRLMSPPVFKRVASSGNAGGMKKSTRTTMDGIYGDMPQLAPTRVRTMVPVSQPKSAISSSLLLSNSSRIGQSPSSSTRANVHASNSDDIPMTIGPEARKRANLLIRRVEPVLAKSILKKTVIEAKRLASKRVRNDMDVWADLSGETGASATMNARSEDAVYINVDDL